MQGSTSNPLQQGGQNQFSAEHINLDEDENINVPDENVNEAASVLDNNSKMQDDVKLKRKRKKSSAVWNDIIEVTLPDGTEKVQCIHCKEHLAVSTGKPTTSWSRHMTKCSQKIQYMRSQKLLNLQPQDVDTTHIKSSPLVGPDTKYDPSKMRESMAHWLMATEQPFATVEDDMFVYMMKTASPMFERVSRNTIKADCFKVYDHEKKKLKALLNETSSVSITTDCWRSSHQKIEYMVITGHYIDSNWRLQKRVLSFVHVPPPRTGRDIGYAISACLKEWEIEGKIFSISVDNASYNDKVVSTLKDDLSRVKKLPCGGRLFHVRCCAHILNLLVKDGLSMIDSVIGEVREAVKYINSSEMRRQIFSNAAQQLQVHDRKLALDVPTRWNSTYDMFSLAINFKDVFPRYAEYEPHFKHVPTTQDWVNVQHVCEVLKVFKMCTNIISGTDYPTANLYLMEVYKVKKAIDEGVLSNIKFIKEMANKMKDKFDKYWGECHLLMAIAAVLDPRQKVEYLKFCYPQIYPPAESKKNIEEIELALEILYDEYLEMDESSTKEATSQKNWII
ncbi:hypothetical protein SSX86_008261 [Deinandra increscens subsp. villosa]|uniref:hAT-like transposase RNase-H fold domain-containing protein n=1 Tax=Deinandra increscens subsp. villosa TaxID=3103831 RepID=A0AAP0H4X0_9ASTR